VHRKNSCRAAKRRLVFPVQGLHNKRHPAQMGAPEAQAFLTPTFLTDWAVQRLVLLCTSTTDCEKYHGVERFNTVNLCTF
jgi:hypothetical protein